MPAKSRFFCDLYVMKVKLIFMYLFILLVLVVVMGEKQCRALNFQWLQKLSLPFSCIYFVTDFQDFQTCKATKSLLQ